MFTTILKIKQVGSATRHGETKRGDVVRCYVDKRERLHNKVDESRWLIILHTTCLLVNTHMT